MKRILRLISFGGGILVLLLLSTKTSAFSSEKSIKSLFQQILEKLEKNINTEFSAKIIVAPASGFEKLKSTKSILPNNGHFDESSQLMGACDQVITNYSNVTIPSTGSSDHTINSTITITNSGTITDLNILDLDIKHDYIDDITINISSPLGTTVTLLSKPCGSEDDILIDLDDEASSSSFPCPPTTGSPYQPSGSLSAFNGQEMNGNWTLTIIDDYPTADGGYLDAWTLDIVADCNIINIVPENCKDNIDNDLDGLTDDFDPDCPCVLYSGQYSGNCTPACQYTPPPGSSSNNFDFTKEWESVTDMTNISQVYVADMDGEPDGVSELVVMRGLSYNITGANMVYILDGKTGLIKYHPNTLSMNSRNKGWTIADADSDGRAEFFYITANDAPSSPRRIVCYEYDPTGTNPSGTGTGTFNLKWISSTQITCGLSSTNAVVAEDFPVNIADFNNDGNPEIYVGNEIYNALNGQRIATGGSNSIGSWNGPANNYTSAYHVNALPVAMDVLPDAACANCAGLELVAGDQVYSVNIATGTMNVERNAPSTLTDGFTAVADYDLDGDLDGIISMTTSGGSYVYIWDLQTQTQIGATHTVKTSTTLFFYHPIGLASIADYDGDGKPEIGVCGNRLFQVIDDYQANISGTGGTLWSITTSDNSGQTGAAVFDFNGDGITEILYRDENDLRLINGTTGANLATIPCGAGTGGEYAVIADIDNDGETEAVCNCTTNPGSSFAIAKTTAFKSDNFPWVPTRKLWNQNAYFVTNINDDLTVPIQQQEHHLVGDPSVGTTGILNNYLKQISPIDKAGNVINPAADLSATIVNVDETQCMSNILGFTISITNNGNLTTPAGLPINFYNGNPELAAVSSLGIVTTTETIEPGNSITITNTVNIGSYPANIFIVVNDDGSLNTPYSLSTDFPITSIPECDFENNSITYLKETCTEICYNGIDDNGNGLTDCDDPTAECFSELSNITVSSCQEGLLGDIATLTVDVRWEVPPSGADLIVKLGDINLQVINVSGGISSPQTITFNIPADGSTNNPLTVDWSNATGDCITNYTYNAAPPCSNNSNRLGCTILYLCGDDKPEDGDAWDHGTIEYINDNNAGGSLTPAFTKNDASGLGLYDPINNAAPLSVDIDDYSLIIVSPTTEGRVAADLIAALKDTRAAVLLQNYLLVDDLGMSSSAATYSFQTDLYIDNSTSVEIYNYNTIDPNYSQVMTGADYASNADAYAWFNAGDQAAGINGAYFSYEATDALPGVPSTHGKRVFLGYHMNGLYYNSANGGAMPVPMSEWLVPATDFTTEGKNFWDDALLDASSLCACAFEIESVNVTSCVANAGTVGATVEVEISWLPNVTDNINVTANGSTQTVNVSTASSPLTLSFNIPADDSVDNLITAVQTVTGCEETATYDTPSTCGVNAGDCPAPTVNAGANITVCEGETVNLSAIASQGDFNFTYSWNNSLGAGQSHSFTGIASPTANNVTDYTVTAIDGNGCIATDVVRVTVLSNPIVSISTSNAYCGQDNGTITFTFTNHTSRTGIEFSINNGSSYPYSISDNLVSFTTPGLSAGSYNLFARWGNNACPVDLGLVTLSDVFAPTVSASVNDNDICEGETVTLTAVGNGGTGALTYTWNNGGGNGASFSVTPSTTTTYTVTVEDSEGCTGTEQVIVNVNDIPTVNAGTDINTCAGDTVPLSATASGGTFPYLYTWDNSLGTGQVKTVYPTITTTYSVTATDNFDCTATDNVTITILPITNPLCSSCVNPADEDNDGVCASEDCDDNDPTLPAPVGTACDDGNVFTIDDKIQQDSCSCLGDYIPCSTNLNIVFQQPDYIDNGTPTNFSDDSFTFVITILGNGNAWTGNGQTGTYGQTVTFGPYPVDTAGITFDILDQDNPNCRENISVNMSSCIYSGVCTCCH